MWNLDGVVITDTTSGGASSSYFDFDAFDEIAVSTGGNDLRVQTGGLGINFVTKRGTNQFHGSARGFLSNDSLQSTNTPDELLNDSRLGGQDQANHTVQIGDYGADIGGPILKDKLWFWASYGKQDIRFRRLNQTFDRTILKNTNAKVNWQAGSKDNVSFFYFNGAKEKLGRSPGQAGTEPDSFLWNQGNSYPEDCGLCALHGLWKWEDNHVFNNNFVLNGKYAWYGWGYGFAPRGGADNDGGIDFENDVAYGSWLTFTARKPWHIVDVSGNYFKSAMGGNHEFKFGFGYRRNPNKTSTTWSGSQVVAQRQSATRSFALAYRARVVSFTDENTSAFFGDTFTKGPATINAGIRWDRQTSKNSASTAPANPTFPDALPELAFAGGGPSIDWKDISPRVSMSYALDPDRKGVVRASYARYAGQLNPFEVTSSSPVGAYYTYIAYQWQDLNGDHFAQRNEILSNLGPAYANAIDPNNPTSVSSVNQLDPKYHANHDHEFIAGIDREVAPNFSVSAAYTYRQGLGATSWNPRIGLSRGDYVLNSSNSSGGFSAEAFAPNPDLVAATGGGRILTNRPDYHTGYNGLEFSANKRLSDRWMMRASFSWMNWKEYFDGSEAIQNPTRSDSTSGPAGTGTLSGPSVEGGQVAPRSSGSGKGDIFYNAKWQFNANALYQLPAGFEVAGSLFGRQGYARPFIFRLDGGSDGTIRTLATADVDTNRYPSVWDLDLRVAKNVRLAGRGSIAITGDLFNVLNSNVELSRNRILDSAAFGTINEILSPRILRVGLRILF